MKITSEEIRKSYPLTPRAVGMFDDDPIGVYSKYDKMNIVDMQGKVLFSYEPDHYLLMQVCFVNPYYILVVGGDYITANRIKVFNLKTKEWEFERLEIDCGDMMEACIAIHHSKPIVAIYRNDGVEIIDIKKRKTIELIANAESIAFCENGEILHTNFETLFLRSNSVDNQKIIDIPLNNGFCDDVVMSFSNQNNAVVISPLGSRMMVYNLGSKELKYLDKPKSQAYSIEFTPDDKFISVSLFRESYLVELETGQEITIEDFEYLDTTRWQDGYIIVLGEKSIRKVELNTLSIK